ncbi:MAG: amidohydrolase family protein, partial [Acidobacteriota bacterium]
MDVTKVRDSVQVKGAVKDYLSGEIGRRSFLRRLTALGFTATAAQQYLALAAAPAGSLQAGDSSQVDILIRGAYVVTMDDERRVFTNGYLAVREGKIVGVGRDSECPFRGGETIDGSDMVVMPGLINAHNHLVQVAGRGRGDDPRRPGITPSPGRDDMQARMRKLVGGQIAEAVHWDEDRSYNMVRLHLLALLKAGTIATHDQHFTNVNKRSIDGVLRAIDDSGMRAFVARGTANHPDVLPQDLREDPEVGLQEVERLRSRWNSSRINVVPSPVAVAYIASGDDIVKMKRGAEAMGAQFEMELAGNTGHMVMEEIGWKGGVIEYLDDLGVLDDTVLGDKGHLLQDQEYQLWKDRGMKVCMMPTLRITDGLGLPVDKFTDVGILPGLGTDSMVTPSGLWRVMRFVIYAQQMKDRREGVRRPQAWGYSERVLEMATRGGAWALFMEDRTGSLEVGKEGDCILIDTRRPYLRPNAEGRRIISDLVWSGESDMVDSVMVAGKFLMRNRE